MALLDDIFGSTLGTGVIVGVGAVLLAPTLLPKAGRIIRPVVKEAVKGGIVLYEGISNGISDIVAEATSEVETPAASDSPTTAGRARTKNS